MPPRTVLTDRQWTKVREALDAMQRLGRPGRNDRLFLEGVLWIHRTGAPWRDLPAGFGRWKTVYNRFARWSVQGRWSMPFALLSMDRGLEAPWTETRIRMGGWPAVTVTVTATVTHHGGRITEHGLRITATSHARVAPVETTSIGSMSTAARSNSIAAYAVS